jgi:hypothetical protein
MKQTIVVEKVQKWKKNLLARVSGKDRMGASIKGKPTRLGALSY